MKKSAIIAIALIVMLIPGMLLAQETCTAKEKAACKATCKAKCCKEMMNLTEEQKAQLVDLKTEYEIAKIKLEAELKILKLEMKHAMAKDDVTEKELKTFVSNMAATKEKLGLKKIDKMMAAKKIMGPENWELYWNCCGAKSLMQEGANCRCGGDKCGMGHGCCSDGSGCEEKMFIMKGGEGQTWIGTGGCHELLSGDAGQIIKCIKEGEGDKAIERCIKVEKKE